MLQYADDEARVAENEQVMEKAPTELYKHVAWNQTETKQSFWYAAKHEHKQAFDAITTL